VGFGQVGEEGAQFGDGLGGGRVGDALLVLADLDPAGGEVVVEGADGFFALLVADAHGVRLERS
jgi:hypothetical protein